MPRRSSSGTIRHAGEAATGKRAELLRFAGTVERDPAIAAWREQQTGALGAIALEWFAFVRGCGDEVREVFHDGCPVACLGDVPFAYVNVFASHVNVGFFQGATLADPSRLLLGEGKRMRHVTLKAGSTVATLELQRLVTAAYADTKARVENGQGHTR